MHPPGQESVNHDMPQSGQGPKGLRLLKFAGALEKEFRRYHLALFLVRMRWALLVAMALFLLFAGLDAISLPEPVRTQILALRLGLMLPVLTLAWLATYRPRLHRWLQGDRGRGLAGLRAGCGGHHRGGALSRLSLTL